MITKQIINETKSVKRWTNRESIISYLFIQLHDKDDVKHNQNNLQKKLNEKFKRSTTFCVN